MNSLYIRYKALYTHRLYNHFHLLLPSALLSCHRNAAAEHVGAECAKWTPMSPPNAVGELSTHQMCSLSSLNKEIHWIESRKNVKYEKRILFPVGFSDDAEFGVCAFGFRFRV